VTKLGEAGFAAQLLGLGKTRARDFYAALAADSAPQLRTLQFAVLGLGDSSYPKFNEAGSFWTLMDAPTKSRAAPRF
jgi:sulfite reductase alpha subunit-like flavoprotein